MYWTLELASKLEDAPWPASKDELIDTLFVQVCHWKLSKTCKKWKMKVKSTKALKIFGRIILARKTFCLMKTNIN